MRSEICPTDPLNAVSPPPRANAEASATLGDRALGLSPRELARLVVADAFAKVFNDAVCKAAKAKAATETASAIKPATGTPMREAMPDGCNETGNQ